VNEVEHGISTRALVIAGRRVDVHLAAGVVETLRHVANRADAAVRHVTRLREVARDDKQALHLRLTGGDVDVP
jgi:hypothetical protein